jgi:hypothetical protein
MGKPVLSNLSYLKEVELLSRVSELRTVILKLSEKSWCVKKKWNSDYGARR